MCGRQTTTLSQVTEINSIYEILYHRIENLARNFKILRRFFLLWKKEKKSNKFIKNLTLM